MADDIAVDRRTFLIGATLVGASLVISTTSLAGDDSSVETPEINAWLVIQPDDTVVIRIAKSEIGQGVFTSNAMMVCEELECGWDKVRPEFAQVNRQLRDNRVYGRMETTAASSAFESRPVLQQVGASARERLKHAAAARWNVDVSEIEARDSVLTHRATGRSLRYGEVVAEAARVKLDHEPAIKTPQDYRLLGTRVARLDTPAKVRGEPLFGIDFRAPDMLYASVRLRPTLDSVLAGFDFDHVKDRPGVLAAVQLRNIGGQDGIAIVADSWWRAETALKAMPIQWSEAGNRPQSSRIVIDGAHETARTRGLALLEDGDAREAFKKAHQIVRAVYETPMQTHAPMESVNCTACVTPERVDVWLGTQSPETSIRKAAKTAGVSTDIVYIHNRFIGGGFGGRAGRGEVEQSVEIAKAFPGRPVKLLWPREEEMRNNAYHPFGVTECEAALDETNHPTALKFTKAGDVTGEPQAIGPLKAVVNAQNARSIYDLPYGVSAARVDIHDMRTGLPVGIWRSVGDYHNVFAIESFVDELALAAGQDPYAYRRALLEASTTYWNRGNWIAALDLLVERTDWHAQQPKGTGLGLAISDHRRPGRKDLAICAAAVQVVVEKNGTLRVPRVHIVFESGLGLLNPLVVEQQLRGQVSWSLGSVWQQVSVHDGRVAQGNFDDYPMVRMADAPPVITIDYLKTDRWNQGVGEMLVPIIPPAICNAVHAAIGKRIRTLPLTPDQLKWT